MKTTRLLLLAAVASLAAGAASAQRTYPPVVDMPIGAQTGRLDAHPATPLPPTAAQPAARDAAAVTYPDVAVPAGEKSPYLSDNVSGPTALAQVVKSEPVPDTPANRGLYRPLSRTGQRSAPAGN
jgi:hypothetical protein